MTSDEPETASTQANERAHEVAIATLRDWRERLSEVSADIHARPELKMNEQYAVQRLSGLLRDAGFTVTEGIAGLPTAFRAEGGTGAPRVSFLCEYDALPEIGHGCGHNLIAAGGLGAGIAAAAGAAAAHAKGTVVVIGTPGEEGGGGKVIELDAGVFDDIDAALMFHPSDATIPIRHATASQPIAVEFHGQAAHAAGSPQDGRSALAGVLQLFAAVDSKRQFTFETTRMHGIITDGGTAPAVVPEYARAEFILRDVSSERLAGLVEWFKGAAQGAAAATSTQVVLTPGIRYTERKNNHLMAGRVGGYLRQLGHEVVQPILRGGTGSSDIGNISLRLPTIHPYLQMMPTGTPTHSREMASYAAKAEAFDGAMDMAQALALTGLDLLTLPGFLDDVREEFATSSADYPRDISRVL